MKGYQGRWCDSARPVIDDDWIEEVAAELSRAS